MKTGKILQTFHDNHCFCPTHYSIRDVLLRFQRSMAMLRIANKRQVELRDSLRKKLSVATQQQKKLRGDQILESLDELVLYGPQLKRALLGGIPKLEGMDEEDEANKKSGLSRSKGSALSAAERALSSSSRARRYVPGKMNLVDYFFQ